MKLPGKHLFFGRKHSPFCTAWLRAAAQRSRTDSWVHKVLFLSGYTVGNTLGLSPFWEQTPTWEGCEGCRAFLLIQQPKPWTKDSPLISSPPASLPFILSYAEPHMQQESTWGEYSVFNRLYVCYEKNVYSIKILYIGILYSLWVYYKLKEKKCRVSWLGRSIYDLCCLWAVVSNCKMSTSAWWL